MENLPDDYEMEELESSKKEDRLSELPHSLILHILSFLPTRDVVGTMLLSKSWRDLWTTIPCLNFTDLYEKDLDLVRNFANHTLMLWRGSKISKFTIDFYSYVDESLYGDIDSWVCFAIVNKVEELCIRLTYEHVMKNGEEVSYRAPECLYLCSSIRKLSLEGCNLQIEGSPYWTQLRSLRLDGYCFSERLINQILLGSPQLEVFVLCLSESREDMNIRSSSLKKLTVNKCLFYNDYQPSTDTVLQIWCPNLETLKVSGFFYRKCLLMNVPSLHDLNLKVYGSLYYDDDGWKDLLRKMMRHIFPTIRHVARVKLSECCLQALVRMQKKYFLSPLLDAKFLKLNVSFIELDEMVGLLGIFPKLEMLVIKQTGYPPNGVYYQTFPQNQFNVQNPMESETNIPKSFLLQLRTLEITSSLSEISIFPFIEFLLKHASMLEKVVIRADAILSPPPRRFLIMVANKLLRMPKSSPTAKFFWL